VEIVQKHAQGISYREWNAGPKCDNDMSDKGFNVSITCDHKETGFCYGGSKHNCGTWMDKNGSSVETKNKGIPATPRDGAPIELVAMQYSILTWLAELNAKGILKEKGIKDEW
jgi:glycogen debranching enzyme